MGGCIGREVDLVVRGLCLCVSKISRVILTESVSEISRVTLTEPGERGSGGGLPMEELQQTQAGQPPG